MILLDANVLIYAVDADSPQPAKKPIVATAAKSGTLYISVLREIGKRG